MRRLLLLALVVVPALAGVDVENQYVMLHQNAGTALEARMRIHCDEVTPGACPGGAGSYDTESPGLTRTEFMDLRAAAASTNCDPATIIGSQFDTMATMHIGAWWSARTADSRAGLCAIVDDWW